MKQEFIPTKDLTREEWLVQRKKGIGGSDVAAILGMSDYSTPTDIYNEKVSEEVHEISNKYTKYGLLLEPAIAEDYEMETGNKVRNDFKIRIHPEHSCLRVNLDRVIYPVSSYHRQGTGILECKSTQKRVFDTWVDEYTGTQALPLYIYCQVMHELSVTGYEWADVAVLLLDLREIRIITIERDDNYIQRQNKALADWWNKYVVTKTPPPPTTVKEIELIEPELGKTIEATGDIAETYAQLRNKDELSKDLDKEIKTLKEKLKLYIGDAEILTLEGDKIAIYKLVRKKEYVVKAQEYRQLRISAPKSNGKG